MPRRPRADFYLHWVRDPNSKLRGWKIRVPYFDEGRMKCRRKLVSKSRYGGTKKSLRTIAASLRDQLIAELGSSTFGMGLFHRAKSSRNTSGYIGVYRIVNGERGEDGIVWAARWVNSEGKIVMRRFHVRRHGEDKAKKLAIRARAEGTKQTADLAWKTVFQVSRTASERIGRNGRGRIPKCKVSRAGEELQLFEPQSASPDPIGFRLIHPGQYRSAPGTSRFPQTTINCVRSTLNFSRRLVKPRERMKVTTVAENNAI